LKTAEVSSRTFDNKNIADVTSGTYHSKAIDPNATAATKQINKKFNLKLTKKSSYWKYQNHILNKTTVKLSYNKLGHKKRQDIPNI
jgi:hypothetical protein